MFGKGKKQEIGQPTIVINPDRSDSLDQRRNEYQDLPDEVERPQRPQAQTQQRVIQQAVQPQEESNEVTEEELLLNHEQRLRLTEDRMNAIEAWIYRHGRM